MIPASYLFKDIYRREWLDPEAMIASAAFRHRNDAPRLDILTRLRRLLASRPRRAHDWSRTPAE